jgi:putative nucleotidyltransferase with HDIG domain
MVRLQQSTADAALDQLVRRIDEISTLPQMAVRIMRTVDDPNSSAADLRELLESDAPLSARVLRYVNSSAFGVRSRITNLQQAIAYLGLKQVRSLALTASVSDLFRRDECIGLYRRSELWRHMVAVALCSRMLARQLNLDTAGPEDLFLAGLLHDIGIILEDQYVHAQFFAAIRMLDRERSLCAMERERIGFDHTELGQAVCSHWQFPELVLDTVRYHHDSDRCRSVSRPVVQCVDVANTICTLQGMPSVGLELVSFSPEALDELGLTKQAVLRLAEQLDGELRANADLLRL